MVNDTILKAAAGEAEQHYFDALSEKYPEDHGFSLRFEKKMAKIIRRANAPVRYRIGRIAVAAVLALVMLFGALVAFSPKVRADVVSWMKRTFKEFTSYIDDDKKDQEAGTDRTEYAYQLGWIPEGYRLVTELPNTTGGTYIFDNEQSYILQFNYLYTKQSGATGAFIKTEGYTRTTGFVHGIPAEIYLTDKENESNVIVWQDPKQGVMFQIFAKESRERLIEMAESVFIKES